MLQLQPDARFEKSDTEPQIQPMKSIIFVLLGTLGGLIGLPLLMWACADIASRQFPQLTSPAALAGLAPLSINDCINWRYALFAGIMFGGLTVVLWRGKHTFLQRSGGALIAVAVSVYPVLLLKYWYRVFDFTAPAILTKTLISMVIYWIPLFIWAFALFFFAVLGHKRPVHP